MAIITPFTSSTTSNLLRCLETLFGFTVISQRRYYTFMASSKIPWQRLWPCLWKLIPEPSTDGRLIVALDDSINPKTGRKIFGCYKFFDHAAKQNQSKYPWSQNIVQLGLLKNIKGRWACLPLAFRFCHLQKELAKNKVMFGKKEVRFQSKMKQSADMIIEIASTLGKPVLAVTDSWFGNNGLWKPLRKKLGPQFHMVSRLRSNSNLFDLPSASGVKHGGRPRKYGEKLGNASSLALKVKSLAKEYTVNLYGKIRTITAHEQVVMLKTLKRSVRVVWVFRKTQWVALFSTDLTLSVEQIVEYYGARWKIESGFKELKQDLGSSGTQTRNPHAVTNHLQFCMMASTVIWIHANRLDKIPTRRHSVKGRTHYAFSDVRRLVSEEILDDNFSNVFPIPEKSPTKSLVATLLRMAA
jgi:DDE superfamily endonuclease